MNTTDDKLRKSALQWVRDHKEELFQELIISSQYNTANDDPSPAASFMAGTPGAGKTELSKRFIEKFEVRPIRIDTDDFRAKIPGYTGANSDVIQSAAALAVDKILEKVFQRRYSFLLDGTFAVGKAVENLKRAVRRGYSIQVFFVYQDPVQAWEFTKLRQQKEGRHVPRDVFINSYFAARDNIRRAKQVFGDRLSLFLIIKDYIKDTEMIYGNIEDVDIYLEKIYNRDELERMLK